MKITYDKIADAAYIYLIEDEEITPGWVAKTYPCNPSEIDGMINLDFDSNGHLGGIEIMDASKNTTQYQSRVDALGRQSFRYIGQQAVLNFNKVGKIITAWSKSR